MMFLRKAKDGGPQSPVDGYFLIEIKWLFSIALLKFNKGAREQYHTHAFNAFTWFLWGDLIEEDVDNSWLEYTRSWLPKITRRDKNHRVLAYKDSWCFTLRGPWVSLWTEDDPQTQDTTIFTHGRRVVAVVPRETPLLSRKHWGEV